MSLLIPSECDYEDAHAQPEIEQLYQKKLQQVTEQEDLKWTFETVQGFFKQSDPATQDLLFRYTEDHLGRVLSWDEIRARLHDLNLAAADNEVYKLVFCARHGQGYHNYVVDKYGIDAWNEKWYALGTDGDVTFGPDPMLTELGIAQAKENNEVWRKEIELHGGSVPSKFYVSPLQRSCWTLKYTWDGLKPASTRPLIMESIRETIGKNLCDKRSSKSVIQQRFPDYDIEPGFSEDDQLFTSERETSEDLCIRVNRFCQGLFEKDWDASKNAVAKQRAIDGSIINTTTHAGTIRSFIVVFGHRRFTISTGGMVPIVVKATRKN